jgi:dihydrofolate reductase
VAKLAFVMNMSIDGYVDHERFETGTSPTLFRHWIDASRASAGSLYGRLVYEAMRYWDGDAWDQHDPAREQDLRAYATAWRREPKWVVSRTLKEVGPNASLLEGDLGAAVRELKARVEGTISVAGTKLGQSLGELGLIDEYRLYMHPVVLGSGKPYFPGPRPPLRFVASDRMDENVIRLTYAPAEASAPSASLSSA